MTQPKEYRKGKHIYTQWGSRGKEVKYMPHDEKKEIKIQIQIDDSVASGMYSNLAFISHRQTEFTFDFIYLLPNEPKGKVKARIIFSPLNAKKFFNALKENIQKYEQRFGEVKVKETTDHKIGF